MLGCRITNRPAHRIGAGCGGRCGRYRTSCSACHLVSFSPFCVRQDSATSTKCRIGPGIEGCLGVSLRAVVDTRGESTGWDYVSQIALVRDKHTNASARSSQLWETCVPV